MSAIGDSTDDFLLSAMLEGDKKAYGILFRRYYPVLCAYTRRFVSLEDAEEIVQDVMFWLWENRETHSAFISLHQYLFKAVYRRALNRVAQNQSRNRADTQFYMQMQEMLEDTDYCQVEELQKQIKIAINNLPESYRESFIMHRFRNLSYKEIAAMLDVSSKTVDYRIQQALKQLRRELRDYLPTIILWLI
jgi:RNA polymerase sigma-70 factor (ECF subfamily)